MCFGLPHVDGMVMLAVGRRTQVLATRTPPRCCLSVLVTWQLASRKTTNPRKDKAGAVMFLYDLALKGKLHEFFFFSKFFWLHRSSPDRVVGQTLRQGSWGPCWRLATTGYRLYNWALASDPTLPPQPSISPRHWFLPSLEETCDRGCFLYSER